MWNTRFIVMENHTCFGITIIAGFNFCLDRAETPESPPAESLHALTVLRKDCARLTHLCAKLADFFTLKFSRIFTRILAYLPQYESSTSPMTVRSVLIYFPTNKTGLLRSTLMKCHVKEGWSRMACLMVQSTGRNHNLA